ncbi:STAS domain-containing protein [Shewanella pealeana]|uniref:Anti-sigma factor antagonist n=1 Tax=Shewanella pealeana (strain ATCC 700345 / ANG-SQ1) TaxID=398579 RepID=A8H2G8_SHEPA|nr:STAS domain-containing protein [Shewanella pealeana]ABV86755.1 anti-sigma-factor antagonist [Shewanella pealeana ATCC 700345]
MTFSQLAQNNACKITLPVEVIMTQTPTLRAAILQQIDAGMSQLIIDLHKVEYIDSSGLSVLISALKRVEKVNGEIVLLSPTAGVRSLIELTRLHQIFAIYEDETAAIDYICNELTNEQAAQ